MEGEHETQRIYHHTSCLHAPLCKYIHTYIYKLSKTAVTIMNYTCMFETLNSHVSPDRDEARVRIMAEIQMESFRVPWQMNHQHSYHIYIYICVHHQAYPITVIFSNTNSANLYIYLMLYIHIYVHVDQEDILLGF